MIPWLNLYALHQGYSNTRRLQMLYRSFQTRSKPFHRQAISCRVSSHCETKNSFKIRPSKCYMAVRNAGLPADKTNHYSNTSSDARLTLAVSQRKKQLSYSSAVKKLPNRSSETTYTVSHRLGEKPTAHRTTLLLTILMFQLATMVCFSPCMWFARFRDTQCH